MKYTGDIDGLLKDIFKGSDEVPAWLYNDIADYLKKGLYEGYGGDLLRFGGQDLQLLEEMRENIYIFSGAKTYQEVQALGELAGKHNTWGEFRKEATGVLDKFNNDWLKTEYETSRGQGQSAIKWQQIEREADDLPMLRYSAILDKNTSEICRPLDGIVAPVGSPIWKKIAPLNHWRCRCILEQGDDFKTTKGNTAKMNGVLDQMDPNFKMNPGTSGMVFNESHPYFDVAAKDKKRARNNFGLDIPEND